jgi:hypothetical protein
LPTTDETDEEAKHSGTGNEKLPKAFDTIKPACHGTSCVRGFFSAEILNHPIVSISIHFL